MQATEQILSLKAMAVNTHRFILFPRMIAGLVALPSLYLIFSAIAVIGSFIMMVVVMGHAASVYWLNVSHNVLYSDLLLGLFKSFVFAFMSMSLAIFYGYFSKRDPQSVAIASTKTVVFSSLFVLVADFLITSFWLKGGL